jgi:hypothetical protein
MVVASDVMKKPQGGAMKGNLTASSRKKSATGPLAAIPGR